MRNLLLFTAFVIVLTSCSTGVTLKENPYFGKFPSMVKAYQQEKIEKEAELEAATESMKESVDPEKLMKMSRTEMEEFMNSNSHYKKAKQLEEDLETWKTEQIASFKEYKDQSGLLNKSVPYEAEGNEIFKITDISTKDFSENNGRISLSVNIRYNDGIKDQRYFPSIYIKAVDEEGNLLSKGVAGSPRMSISANTEGKLSLGLEGETQEDFAKIVQITKEEYDSI